MVSIIFNREKILLNIDKSRLELSLHDTIGSTNDFCKITTLKKEFLVVASDMQTKGRGRQGKKWISPAGNISFSIAYENADDEPISLIAGVISQLAISIALNVSEIKLKWPNDLIYKNKKIGGILVEREISGSQNKTIVGIGINLALNEKEPWWGDLKSFNIQNSRDDILNNLIRGFFKFTDGDLVNWVELWNLHCAHKNKIIKIFNNKILIDEGIFAGINSKGALLLKSDKDLKEYNSGEILIEGIY